MYKTEQENFWSGEFGNEYISRNNSLGYLTSSIGFWSSIIKRTVGCHSVIELGSNIGINLKAIKTLKPEIKSYAVEINHKAAEILQNDPFFQNGELEVFEESILEFDCKDIKCDMSFTKGVLIHINPDELNAVYERLYNLSKKYICIAEYYNPVPVEVEYRGNNERLYKRDFAGEFMKKYPDVTLVDYGFVYHGDNNFSDDDITWFLIQK